jgi:hypothetical protein
MTVTVRIVTRFGARYIYPACDRAKLFCLIANTKTLTTNMLALIQELGFEIVVSEPELSPPPQQTSFTPDGQVPVWWSQRQTP